MSVSPEASMYPRPRPGNLREVAEKIQAATGLRVQIVGGKLVMSPTPRGKHAGVLDQIRRRSDGVLPEGLGTVLPVLDPRKGAWALRTRPDNGAYQDVLPGKFGESVRLPEPLGMEIVTDEWPVYGDPPRRTPSQKGPFTERSQ